MGLLQGDSHHVPRQVIQVQERVSREGDLLRSGAPRVRGRRRAVESEVFYIDPCTRAERHSTFDHMGEFTHVAWPGVLLQTAQRLWRQVPCFEVVGSRVALEKGLREQGNIFSVLAQGRDVDDHHVQTIV